QKSLTLSDLSESPGQVERRFLPAGFVLPVPRRILVPPRVREGRLLSVSQRRNLQRFRDPTVLLPVLLQPASGQPLRTALVRAPRIPSPLGLAATGGRVASRARESTLLVARASLVVD